jgi:acetoin utilization protein AcuB
MTKDPLTLSPEDTLMTAVELMRSHHFRRIPVLLGGTVVGILAQGDVKRALPSPLQGSEEDYEQVMHLTPISQIMIRDPVTVEADHPLLEAAQTLNKTKYGALPVLREGRLVGILTDTDLSRCLVDVLSQGG